MIRGPVVLGDHAQIKMGAKIYGPCAFGPACRIGGEVNNSVFQGYSNKGHDGFLDMFRGSKTERVLRAVNCPLMAVPA